MSQESNGSQLLGKKVNLLYLIFIILAFLYIPADFVDIFRGLNEFYETDVADNQKLYSYNSQVISSFEQDEANITKLKNDCESINNSARILLNKIRGYKIELIKNSGGYNINGYISRGKNYQLTKKILVNNFYIDSIKEGLSEHAEVLRSMTNKEFHVYIDSALYLIPFVASDGEKKSFKKFLFREVPVSAAAAVLTSIESNILELNNQIIGNKLEGIISLNDSLRFGIQSEILKKEYSSTNYGNYSPGEEIVVELKLLESDNVTGTQDFEIYDYKRKNNIQKFYSAEPVIDLKNLPVIYTGIYNIINIREKDFPGYIIETEVNSGQLLKRNGRYNLIVKNTGIVQLDIYGNKPGEKTLLDKKEFLVRKLPAPIPQIGDRFSGTISSKIFKIQKGIELKYSDRNFPEVIIKTFNIKRIGDGNTENQTNRGAFFNAGTRKLIDAAKRGDVYLFDNIEGEDFEGKTVKLFPVVLTIK